MNKLLNQIFRDYYNDVYRYLYSLSHDAALSEELTSEVFLSVIVSLGRFRGESDIKTWLFSIARHKYFSYLRKHKYDMKIQVLSEIVEERDTATADDRLYVAELYDRIKYLLSLEDERTSGIVLMRTEGYSFYEISKKYGISENSARVIFFRAKEKIRSKLKEEGYTYE